MPDQLRPACITITLIVWRPIRTLCYVADDRLVLKDLSFNPGATQALSALRFISGWDTHKHGAYTETLRGLCRGWLGLKQAGSEQESLQLWFQQGSRSATLQPHRSLSIPRSGRLCRRMGVSTMEDSDFDSFELLYSGCADRIKSHKSNLNLSKLVTLQPQYALCNFSFQ